MTRSTTVYDNGSPVTIGQLLDDLRRAPVHSLMASYYANRIRGAMILANDFPRDICEEIDRLLKEKGEPPLTIGSQNNQQAGLVCPPNLVNYIFHKHVNLQRMWMWIRDHFLPIHIHDYDWFALLRFLADNQMLAKGIQTSNPKFSKQMAEWFPTYDCTDNNVKIYRTGYLGATPYKRWDKARFSKEQRSNQKIEGFNHLDKICNSDLTLACEEDDLNLILENN